MIMMLTVSTGNALWILSKSCPNLIVLLYPDDHSTSTIEDTKIFYCDLATRSLLDQYMWRNVLWTHLQNFHLLLKFDGSSPSTTGDTLAHSATCKVAKDFLPFPNIINLKKELLTKFFSENFFKASVKANICLSNKTLTKVLKYSDSVLKKTSVQWEYCQSHQKYLRNEGKINYMLCNWLISNFYINIVPGKGIVRSTVILLCFRN